jgi:hypothetical protein
MGKDDDPILFYIPAGLDPAATVNVQERQRKVNKRTVILTLTLFVLTAVAAIVLMAPGTAAAGGSPENVYWFWDGQNPVGSASLNRNAAGLSANLSATGLPAGQAVTLWFIFFNHPENCLTNPCSLPDDLFTPGVDGDFHLASGHVTGSGGVTGFGGALNVGDVSRSGRAELGAGAVPLTNQYGAEVVMALHSHGPALTGADLAYQISSFLGGCDVFNGPNGFASGPGDVPDAVGECSTIQYALFQAD